MNTHNPRYSSLLTSATHFVHRQMLPVVHILPGLFLTTFFGAFIVLVLLVVAGG